MLLERICNTEVYDYIILKKDNSFSIWIELIQITNDIIFSNIIHSVFANLQWC